VGEVYLGSVMRGQLEEGAKKSVLIGGQGSEVRGRWLKLIFYISVFLWIVMALWSYGVMVQSL